MVIENVMNDDGTMSVGQELFDRTVENGDRWNIIVEKETGEVYGTGYYYIPKGTKLKNGQEATTNWLVDKSGKMKELKDDTFTRLDFESTVGVKEGLIFNMDATNIGDGQDSWGDNVTLRYFDDTVNDTYEERKLAFEEQKKFTSVLENDNGYDRLKSTDSNLYIDSEQKSFKLNGNNYIEISHDGGFDFSKGLTFEFYGKISGYDGTLYSTNTGGVLSLWNRKLWTIYNYKIFVITGILGFGIV